MTTPTTSPRVLLAPTLDLALGVDADITIEAEFGASVVMGRSGTFAHHVPSAAGNPSPCADDRIRPIEGGIILLSHLDLDSIGGALRALPGFEDLFTGEAREVFWRLAGAVDVRGPHRIAEALDAASVPVDLREPLTRVLRAFWAWSRTRPRLPRDVVSDVTVEVKEAGRILGLLLSSDEDGDPFVRGLMEAGDAAAAAEDALEASSRLRVVGGVVVREADCFVSHLHRDGIRPARGTVSRNTANGAITLALANPEAHPGVSCAVIARALWGPEAGGHAGIAGSPRGVVMPEEDLARATDALVAALDAPAAKVPETPEQWWRPMDAAPPSVMGSDATPVLMRSVEAMRAADPRLRRHGQLIEQDGRLHLRVGLWHPTRPAPESSTWGAECLQIEVPDAVRLPVPPWCEVFAPEGPAWIVTPWTTTADREAKLAQWAGTA